jgi:hypothetical protein
MIDDEEDGDTITTERPPGRRESPKPSEPQQPNGWRCESCNRRSHNREALCHPVPA